MTKEKGRTYPPKTFLSICFTNGTPLVVLYFILAAEYHTLFLTVLQMCFKNRSCSWKKLANSCEDNNCQNKKCNITECSIMDEDKKSKTR